MELDGKQLDTYSDEYKGRCEVRYLLSGAKKHGKSWVDTMLSEMRKPRGDKSVDALQLICRDQWLKGNRGLPLQWYA